MSIYATLWCLRFPEHGDDHIGCEWVEVIAQGVPAHIGSPTPGHGYETGDPYGEFLPPPIEVPSDDDITKMRAVVFIREGTKKGTKRSHQEYENPLLVLSGEEYERISFAKLHEKLCSALRGDHPRVVMQILRPDGATTVHFEDGSSREVGRRREFDE
jgi:hypothetical protein